jgi:hypothetical protein
VAIAAAAGIATGIAMQLALWSPDPTPDIDYYNLVFSGHSTWTVSAVGAPAIAGVCGYLIVPMCIDMRRERAVMLGWMGLATWIGALIVAGFIVLVPDAWGTQPDWRLMVVRALFATSGGITAIHLTTVILFNRSRRRRPLTPLPVKPGANAASSILSAASSSVAAFARGFTIETTSAWAIVIATAAATVAEIPSPSLGFQLAVVIASIAVTAKLARDAANRPPAVLVAVAYAGMVWWAIDGGGPGLFGMLVVWVWLSIGREWGRPAVTYACLGMIPCLILATGTDAVSPDTFLRDTYYATGHAHFIFATIGFAMLAVVAPRTKLASAAALVVCVSLIVHAAAMLWLGTMGMPRRYVSYDNPMFASGFHGTAIAAVAAAAGLVLSVFAVISSPPWLERSSSS